jgi:hypothetical protein
LSEAGQLAVVGLDVEELGVPQVVVRPLLLSVNDLDETRMADGAAFVALP